MGGHGLAVNRPGSPGPTSTPWLVAHRAGLARQGLNADKVPCGGNAQIAFIEHRSGKGRSRARFQPRASVDPDAAHVLPRPRRLKETTAGPTRGPLGRSTRTLPSRP
jgi:hypothetical protein